ncbi:MAG: DUF3558 domain-containing protein [Pseudonocardia sp.]
MRFRIVVAVLLVAGLSGCAPAAAPAAPHGAPAVNPQRPYDGLEFDISLVPPDMRVRDPLDLRGVEVCDLLTDAQLTELGLRPETADKKFIGTRGNTDCAWTWADDKGNYASVGAAINQPNPVLPGYYAIRDGLAGFEQVEIGGYQAIRADTFDNGSCEIVVIVSDDQSLGLADNAAGRPMADPCARPRRMAELILPTLPPRPPATDQQGGR